MPAKNETDMTPENLEAFARHINETADSLRAQAEIMRSDHLEQITVVAWQQTCRGRKFLDAFLSVVRDSIADARETRGDFPPSGLNGKKAKKGVPDSGKRRPEK